MNKFVIPLIKKRIKNLDNLLTITYSPDMAMTLWDYRKWRVELRAEKKSLEEELLK